MLYSTYVSSYSTVDNVVTFVESHDDDVPFIILEGEGGGKFTEK